MLNFDALIVFAVVVVAAVYLYRKFSGAKKGHSCSCSSGGDCCQRK